MLLFHLDLQKRIPRSSKTVAPTTVDRIILISPRSKVIKVTRKPGVIYIDKLDLYLSIFPTFTSNYEWQVNVFVTISTKRNFTGAA